MGHVEIHCGGCLERDREIRRLKVVAEIEEIKDAEAAILNCLDACANDEGEPERYASWYANTARAIRDGRYAIVDNSHETTTEVGCRQLQCKKCGEAITLNVEEGWEPGQAILAPKTCQKCFGLEASQPTTTLSEEQLREWERITDEASQGPWQVEKGTVYVRIREENEEFDGSPSYEEAIFKDKHAILADCNFIALSRDVVPSLIAEVRRLRVENEFLQIGVKTLLGLSDDESVPPGIEEPEQMQPGYEEAWLSLLLDTWGDTRIAELMYRRGKQFNLPESSLPSVRPPAKEEESDISKGETTAFGRRHNENAEYVRNLELHRKMVEAIQPSIPPPDTTLREKLHGTRNPDGNPLALSHSQVNIAERIFREHFDSEAITEAIADLYAEIREGKINGPQFNRKLRAILFGGNQ